jgi:RNA polymerase-associated protein
MSLRIRVARPLRPLQTPAQTRAGLTLYSHVNDWACHWVRMVVAEKDIDGLRIEYMKPGVASEDLLVLNPSQSLPTLADREVVLSDAQIMIEYLDERYPHPPMMPVEPAARARLRSALLHMRQDLFPLTVVIRKGPAASAQKARKLLIDSLPAVGALITTRGHFLTGELNSADCAWATLLWRLPSLGIKLAPEHKVLQKYAEKLFARPAFKQSLTDAERALNR